MVLLFFSKVNVVLNIFFIITAYLRVIFELLVEKEAHRFFNTNKKKLFQFLFDILWKLPGLHSIILSAKILTDIFDAGQPTQICSTYPIFHISNENLSVIKIYCYIYLVIKSIPQLFIMSIVLGGHNVTGITAYLSTANIVLNMMLFAFTMSITFPIRKTPRIFTNFVCLLFSAVNKFLATLCGCCANLSVFIATFRNAEYYAFLAHFIKTIIWVFPCQTLLSVQPIPLSKIQFATYLIFFPIIFSFVFIHPFEKTWRLHYYFAYLFNGLLDLAFIGLWTDVELTYLSYCYILRIVQIGFLSCYGLLNSFTKGKDCETMVNMTANENDEEIEKREDEEDAGEANTSGWTQDKENENTNAEERGGKS